MGGGEAGAEGWGESGGDVGGARHGMRKWEDTNRKWRWKF